MMLMIVSIKIYLHNLLNTMYCVNCMKNRSILGCLLLSYPYSNYKLCADKFIWTSDKKILNISLIEFIQNRLNLN